MSENENITTEEIKEPLPKNMKLCKACGKQIAKSAKRCPSCGAKNKKPLLKRFWFWVLAIAAIFGIVSIIRENKSYDLTKPDFTLLSDEMMKEFSDDESAAKSKFKYKVISLTGPVGDVRDDCVRIDCYTEELMLYAIDVYMEDKAELAKFKKGTVVTVVGVGSDKFLLGRAEMKKAIIADSTTAVNYSSASAVSIGQICKAYSDNAVNANGTYLYKPVEISGNVSFVCEDYIVLREKEITLSLEGIDECIYVYFENPADVSSVKEGSRVTIVGQCFGGEIVGGVKVTRAKLK